MITEQDIKYRICCTTIVSTTIYYFVIYALCIHWWLYSEHRGPVADIFCVSVFFLALLANIYRIVSSIKEYKRPEKD